MATIKIYPPQQLPAEGVTDVQFKIWTEELEVYLDIDDRFQKFLPGGRYDNWLAAESNPDRLITAKAPDRDDDLPKFRRELRQMLTIIAKLIHTDYYNPILRQSTSLQWIYTRLRQDYDILQQGIHFLNILDVKYDITASTTPTGLYNNYRSLIMGSLGKKGDKIGWQNKELSQDENLSPTFEDLILLNVLNILHPRLPAYVKDQYAHKIGETRRIMDYKVEILTKAKQYIEEIESIESQPISVNNHVEVGEDPQEPDINYISTRGRQRDRYQRSNYRPRRFQQSNQRQQPNRNSLPPYCRLCQLSGQPRSTFSSHYVGDESCPSMSDRDRSQLIERVSSQLSNVQLQEEPDLEAEYGYASINHQHEQVDNAFLKNNDNLKSDNNCNFNYFSDSKLNFIKPVPSQILTVQDANGLNVHLDLDTGATCSYVKYDAAKKHNFKIMPNTQTSKLADGVTKMSAVGEINEIFYRNGWEVKFCAIVTRELHTNFVAGNNFFQENEVTQDISNKSITVHKKYTVPETNKLLILPTSANNTILHNNHMNVVLPGQSVSYPTQQQEDQVLAVQPCPQSKSGSWPPPQLCKVSNGFIHVVNNTDEVFTLKKANNKITARTLDSASNPENKCLLSNVSMPIVQNDNYKNVQINCTNIDKQVVDYVKSVNEKFKDVFNDDLQQGYNMKFGRHVCSLNWANDTRPPANKVHNINYDHSTKVLLQQVIDEFTQSEVLGIPQDHNIHIQHVSPVFLVRKQREKNKPKNELTSRDVRMVVNFGNINEHLKNIPTPITKPKDIFTHLGRWKYVISMDLFQGFFQNHINPNDSQWLGISSPFGGLRFMRRSGQGLLGQSEELDELLSKVLCNEMKLGIVARIADDIFVGGATPLETAQNYENVLEKLHAANLKVSADKTKIFLESMDVLGWVWKHGGFISPSPHRVNSLKNTCHNDITCVKDMRSWIGLFKTLLPATKNLTMLLDPFDKAVADKQSKEPIQWDESLKISFNKAKEAIDSIQTLYLPHPNDQLMIVVDAAKAKPGLGHILYAIKNNHKLPVSFHSTKLSENHSKWHSCELEALAFATAITAEYNILKESTKPILITPDSKAVADAVNLIKKGKHSSSPRIQALITNVNRLPLIVQLANGKNNLNNCADFQSRNPSTCLVEHCTICNFVNEMSENTINPHAINAINDHMLDNKLAWKKIQDESKSCTQAKFHITTGKTPSKVSGKLHSEVRRLTSVATISKDGLLVVLSKPTSFSSKTNELIVIPSSHLPAVLWQIHNSLHHPTKSQLKSQFEKSFYSVGLHPELDKLYNDCHFCVTQKKIPSIVPHYTKDDSNVPGVNFHADIIKRRTQCILTIRDNFSSYTVAKIVRSEQSKDLKSGIIDLLTPIKLAGNITVKVDNCSGFKPILDGKDQDLNKLGILVIATDVFNINANSVVDRACQELEQELVRLEPDGRQISNTTLQIAVQLLNSKLRRNGKISAFEIYFNRDLKSGDNLNLNYQKIKDQQTASREYHNIKHNDKVKLPIITPLKTGDIVTVKTHKHDKHKAKDIYMVTSENKDNVKIQRVIHSFNSNPSIRSKTYTTSRDRLHVVKSNLQYNLRPRKNILKTSTEWNPIREYQDSDDEDNYVVPPVTVSKTSSSSYPTSTLTQYQPEIIHDSSANDDNLVPTHTTETADERPQLYQQLDNWLNNQRLQAAQQLTALNQSVNEHSDSDSPSETDATDKRSIIKARAKQRIAATYHKNIPQVDGHVTDNSNPPSVVPSAATSVNPTPDTSPVKPVIPPAFLDQLRECHSSLEWDYQDVDVLENAADLDDVFDLPYADVDFMARHASI